MTERDHTRSARTTQRPQLDVADLYDHAPFGYVTTLPDGSIVDVNATFLAWTGHRREELVGVRRFAELLPPGVRVFHVSHHLPALERAGEMREVASEIVCADGRRLPVMLSSTLHADADGRTQLILMAMSDATARRSYERELRTANDQERAAREHAERLVVELGRRGREQAAIVELGRMALADTDPQELLERAAAAIRQALGVEQVRIREPHAPDLPDPAPSGGVVVPIGEPDRPYAVLVLEGERVELGPGDRDFLETLANVVWLAVERRRLDERHRRLALHDPLTGLPNRALLFDRLDLALAIARRRESRVAVLMLDLDGFKEINDSLGHHAGDVVLQVLGGRLAAAVRASDTIGRLGGDEFAAVCDVVDAQDTAALVRRLAAAIAEPIRVEGTELRVTASIGSVVTAGDADPRELLREADRAMYDVKNARGGEVRSR